MTRSRATAHEEVHAALLHVPVVLQARVYPRRADLGNRQVRAAAHVGRRRRRLPKTTADFDLDAGFAPVSITETMVDTDLAFQIHRIPTLSASLKRAASCHTATRLAP